LSLKLYLDDCAYSRRLCQLLREAGHDVQTPVDLVPSLLGADDAAHFAHAQAAGRAILTLNARDFKALHDRDADHAGILVVYQDNDPRKDMRYADIVRAIANLERSVPRVAGGFWILNLYRW
jgi:hypothetical protein